MLSELKVNDYIAVAENALRDTPEYQYLTECLRRYQTNDIEPAGIEAVLSCMWTMKIGYIIENLDDIKATINENRTSCP